MQFSVISVKNQHCIQPCSFRRKMFWHGVVPTYLLTSWSRVLLEKLTGSQLVNKFPAFYETRSPITAFTRTRHLSLSWANSIQSIPPHPAYWISILILYSHLCLGLPSGLFPSGFPTTTLHTPLLSSIRATCPRSTHSTWLYHPKNIGRAVQNLKLLIMTGTNATEIFSYHV